MRGTCRQCRQNRITAYISPPSNRPSKKRTAISCPGVWTKPLRNEKVNTKRNIHNSVQLTIKIMQSDQAIIFPVIHGRGRMYFNAKLDGSSTATSDEMSTFSQSILEGGRDQHDTKKTVRAIWYSSLVICVQELPLEAVSAASKEPTFKAGRRPAT